ncbi:hypothetical protein [Streptomyces gardneri]|uniref:Uncharacterized protein n=1 Tax=Streptomyces gardneri TaxID=66892 RepID=A0A4Y3RXX8_9ACTN|nr:hypothetical protein [Streptomyces gardneri]GEB62149.1 hypothetical protein SGA01_77540 [Streptomyces gardneri]GHH23693.1 hypothetical protein GCM10017674_80520 [Streptomyces gardneri]
MGDFIVNTSVVGGQSQPCADALNSNALFTALWADDSDAGIKGQRVDTAGAKVGTEFLASEATPPGDNTNRQWPFLDSVGMNTFAAWIEQPFNLPPPTPVVVLRRFFDGQPSGPQVQVSTDSIDPQFPPTVTRMVDGGCLVTWTGAGEQKRIRAQRFTPEGQKTGPEIAVNTTAAFHRNAAVTLLSNGDYVVAWTNGDPVGGGGLVYRVFQIDGTPRTGEMRPNVSGFTGRSALTALDNGRFVAAHIKSTVQSDLGVLQTTAVASVIDPAGNGSVILSASAGSPKHFHRTSPALTALPGGHFVLAWVEKSADTFQTVPTVMAQLCSDTELEIGPRVQASSGTNGNRFHLSAAAVFSNGNPGNVFLSWADMADGGDTTIRGSVLTAGPGGLSS